MHQAIYDKLVSVARSQSTVCYSEIAPLAGLDMSRPPDRNIIGEILGEISTYEHEQGRPMLTVVVVRKDKNMPGPLFFNLARELGVQHGDDNRAFFYAELRRVHDCWRGK